MSSLTLTRSDHGSTIDLTVGAVVRIELPENPTTGYRWALGALDAAVVAVEHDHYRADTGGVGAGGTRTIALIATGEGTTTVSAELRRSWEAPDQAIDRFSVVVIVAPAAA
jgi:inhibitor of cysteine peptidase